LSNVIRIILKYFSILCVIGVFIAPVIITKKTEFLHVGLILGFVSALLSSIPLIIPILLLFLYSLLIEKVKINFYEILIIVSAPVVSTLPGMVEVHRKLLGWHSYAPHMEVSIAFIFINVSVALAISVIIGRNKKYKKNYVSEICFSCSLIVSSITNIFLPWWPLD